MLNLRINKMKMKLFPTLSILLATAMFTSCNKDENSSNSLEDKKPVVFAK
ncbi:hypothetical protein HMPREF9296_1247, partial [Prevotella disiens FB035-09AN]